MKERKLIKVCGLKDPGNIAEVAVLRPDFVGLIFYQASPRYAGHHAGLSETRKNDYAPARVGVFVNESAENIRRVAQNYNLDYIQLHGNESADFCSRLHAEGFRILKAFRIHRTFDFSLTQQYASYAALFIFDTPSDGYGGSGKQFDWSLLDQYHGPVPFLLSGGIGPANLEEILVFDHPFLAGYDLNSRFETSPGIKDISALSGFINNIRKIS